MTVRKLAAALALSLIATAAYAETSPKGFFCNSAPATPVAKPEPTQPQTIKPAAKVKVKPGQARKGFFCNSAPPEPEKAPATTPAPDPTLQQQPAPASPQ